jgi:hypothetical protein
VIVEICADGAQKCTVAYFPNEAMAGHADQADPMAARTKRYDKSFGPSFPGRQIQCFAPDLMQFSIGSQVRPCERFASVSERLDDRIPIDEAGFGIKTLPSFGPVNGVEDRSIPIAKVQFATGKGVKAKRRNGSPKEGRAIADPPEMSQLQIKFESRYIGNADTQ